MKRNSVEKPTHAALAAVGRAQKRLARLLTLLRSQEDAVDIRHIEALVQATKLTNQLSELLSSYSGSRE